MPRIINGFKSPARSTAAKSVLKHSTRGKSGLSGPLSRGCDDFLDAHRLDAPDEIGAEDAVPITKQIARRGIVWKAFKHLLGGPPDLFLRRAWQALTDDFPRIVGLGGEAR